MRESESETERKPMDLATFCRVCLQQPEDDDLLDLELIYDEDENLSYGECFTVCTEIVLNADGNTDLPHNLCKSCGLELQVAYDFKKKIEISKRFLSQLTQSKKNFTCSSDLTVEDDHGVDDDGNDHLILSDDDLLACADYEYLETDVATAKTDDFHELVEFEQDDETLYEKVVNEETNNIETVDDAEQEVINAFTVVDYVQTQEVPAIAHSNYEQQQEPSDEHDHVDIDAEENTCISWQTAVVTVANEAHLPLINAEEADDDNPQQADLCMKIYESDENTQDTTMPASATTNDDASNAEGMGSRKRYSGKFTCNYCQKVFPNHSRMKQHRLSHESNRPTFPCSQCERIYATKQAMRVHLQTVHTKTASHACSICGKIYAIRKGLEVHMRYHTGNFPYECDLCDRKFAQISHLKTHKNVKHNSERFACEHPNCGKFFTSSASLRNHEFSHGLMPFECEFCQRGYPAKAKLKVHVRRKHGHEMTLDELERMRKFHVIRSKLNLVKVTKYKE